MHDVIVVDEEFESSHAAISAACARIDSMIEYYCLIMDRTASLGAFAGATSEALKAFVSCAEELKNVASALADQHGEAKNLFLASVDNADRFLY